MRISPEHCNVYKVIGESNCSKLYFDIECSRELSPDFKIESAMEIFKDRVSRELGMIFGHIFSQDMFPKLLDGSVCSEMFPEKHFTNGKKSSGHLAPGAKHESWGPFQEQ